MYFFNNQIWLTHFILFIRCLVFLEEKSILEELEIENDSILKIHQDMIEDLREQVDSLKTNCLDLDGRNY